MAKVLYFDISGRGGGSNESLRILLAKLDRRRFQPVLCFGNRGSAARWPGERVVEMNVAGFDNYDFFPAGWNLPWIYHLLRFLLEVPFDVVRIWRLLRNERPDLVHVNGGQALTVGVVAHRMGYPVIWHVRELVSDNLFRRFQRAVYRRHADRLLAISRAVAQRLAMTTGRVRVLYNPVERPAPGEPGRTTFRARFGIGERSFVVLLLGNMTWVKGYGFLADVAEQLCDVPDLAFVVAGDCGDVPADRLHRLARRLYRFARRTPGERQAIRARWGALVDEGRAVLPGRVEAFDALVAADLVVCPNLVPEPFGRTVVEAQAAGRPVITSRMPAFDDLIVDGDTGWLLPLDVEEWAAKIRELAANREVAARAGQRGRAAAERFDPDEYANQVMAMYQELLSARAFS